MAPGHGAPVSESHEAPLTTRATPIRVLLVDDQPLLRAGVRRVLEAEPDLRVVGEAGHGEEALVRIAEHDPELVVLDLNMPGMDGFAVLRELRARGAAQRVLVLSLHSDPAYVSRAVREGADGYLLKDTAVQELPRAIRAVMAGSGFYSPGAQFALGEAMRATEKPALARLTRREIEVLVAIAEGKPSKAIAYELGIGLRTIETHRANLMRKLELHSVAELTRFAIANGLIPPP